MSLTTLKVERDIFPVAAFDFIGRQKLSGKMVCTFNWAQYALDAFGPRESGQAGILVQVDGRCRTSYSQEMLDMHFDFLLGDEPDVCLHLRQDVVEQVPGSPQLKIDGNVPLDDRPDRAVSPQ